jgi:hypothetical protein
VQQVKDKLAKDDLMFEFQDYNNKRDFLMSGNLSKR